MKKFYFDGDSWMNGGGLELCGLPRKSRWSTLVCEHFGAEETNLAVGGAPIDTAMRHLFTGKCKKKEIPLHEFDMFFIQLSYPRRSCLLYTSPSPRDNRTSRMPSSA